MFQGTVGQTTKAIVYGRSDYGSSGHGSSDYGSLQYTWRRGG